MEQVSQNYRNGALTLETVDPPALKADGVIVRTVFSVISQGTEGMKVREAKMNLLEKARARPDQVRNVLQTAQQQGMKATYQKVMNRLEALTPLGYALSGYVEAVGARAGEFEVGQRVACAGAGYANHAEFNYIPRNLVVPVPDGVSMEQAAFATIGSIALHGFRQSALCLGESAVVIGLGLIGQVLVQILRAAGVHAFGVDLSEERCCLAERCGAVSAGAPDSGGWRQALLRATGGNGADAVFLTVGSSSNAPLELAVEVSRDRGRIVAVGKTKLDLDYNTFFQKEVDVRFSRSYGPGRYDPNYEERGQDYPIGYVRWTERRNLAAFLALIEQGQIDLSPIISGIYDFSAATTVYEDMHEGRLQGIGILFRYRPDVPYQPHAGVATAPVAEGHRPVGIGAIGAGNYALSMLLPHLKQDERASLLAVATASSLSAASAAKKFGFAQHGTDYRRLLANSAIHALFITTRHASHAAMTAEALRAGKTVFVEKPLAIDEAGLDAVVAAAAESGNDRLLVGFNRRFSPIIQTISASFRGIGPLHMIYRVHAGALDRNAWQRDPSEGSRFVGEAGHFFDVFAYLTGGAKPVSVAAHVLHPAAPTDDDLENMSVTVSYADGSVGTLVYLTQGGMKVPKEYLEVFGGGYTAVMDNFQTLTFYDSKGGRKKKGGFAGDKGQKNEVAAFVEACAEGAAMPISFTELVDTTRVTLKASEAAQSRKVALIGTSV